MPDINDAEKKVNLDQEFDHPRSSNNPVIDWIIRLFKGGAVGIGGVLPGLSGGVLSVIFGVYDPIIKWLANPFKNFWKNIKYFLPYLIGGVLGIFVFATFVSEALNNYQEIAISLFLGFVAGTVPSLYRKAGEKGRTSGNIITLVGVSILFTILMILANNELNLSLPSNFLVWMFAGGLIGLGVIVPGLSPSNFLLYFDLYEKMTTGISELDFSIIIPLGIGLVLIVLLLAKVIEYLFKKYYATMNHLILSLVIGSTIAIAYTHIFTSFTGSGDNGMLIVWVIVAFIIGTILSYLFSIVEDRVEAAD